MATSNPTMMRAYPAVAAILALLSAACEPPAANGASAARAQADTALAPWNPTLGAPAPRMRWVRHDAPRVCEWPAEGGTIPKPDSAGAVAVARRALNATDDQRLTLRTALQLDEGYFLQFETVADPGTIVMDGSASVYVTWDRCVALLGW